MLKLLTFCAVSLLLHPIFAIADDVLPSTTTSADGGNGDWT
jgi:hypothetical protein